MTALGRRIVLCTDFRATVQRPCADVSSYVAGVASLEDLVLDIHEGFDETVGNGVSIVLVLGEERPRATTTS